MGRETTRQVLLLSILLVIPFYKHKIFRRICSWRRRYKDTDDQRKQDANWWLGIIFKAAWVVFECVLACVRIVAQAGIL